MTEAAAAPPGPADDARPQDLQLYAAMLTFTKQRLAYTDELLSEKHFHRVKLETCALQIRIALEHIVLSTLVTNRPGAAAVVSAFARKNAGDVHGLIRRLNPKYWPIPFQLIPPDEGESSWRMAAPDAPYLHEDEWGRAYGYCSTLLHATNPYQYLPSAKSDHSRVDKIPEHVQELKILSKKLQVLIKRHQIHLSESDVSLICEVPDDTSIKPKVEVWVRARPKEDSSSTQR